MGWNLLFLAALAAWFNGFGEAPVRASAALVMGVVAYLSYRAARGYAQRSAEARKEHRLRKMAERGKSEEEIERVREQPLRMTVDDAGEAPNGLTFVNMLSTVSVLVLLVWGLVD